MKRRSAGHARRVQACKRHRWALADTITVCACCGQHAPRRLNLI